MGNRRPLFVGIAKPKRKSQRVTVLHLIVVYHIKNLDYEISFSGRPDHQFTSQNTVDADTFKSEIEKVYGATDIELKYVASTAKKNDESGEGAGPAFAQQ
jgi:hypothetical protein